MAASATDKARKSYSYLQKTLNTGISASDNVLTPNNVTNIPTDTGVSFVIDRVDSSGNKTPTLRELMTGYVSGGTIASLVRGEQGTTAQAHLANAVIEFVNSGKMWNDLIDFLLQDHSNPNGNHKTLTDDNSNEWLERGSVASAVNQVKITNAITGKNPTISANGDDTNIQLDLTGKGTGYAVARNPDLVFDFILGGTGIWSGLGYGSLLTAAMTAATCYINGRRISIAAIASRAFTASKDTYVDVLDNQDGTGTVVYTEVANNAASPALAANSVRMAIIVSGANIAAATSINQGQESMVLPIASSTPYAVTDSLGNLICPRDPNHKIVGYRQLITAFGTTSTSNTLVTGMAMAINVTQAMVGRKIKIHFQPYASTSATGTFGECRLFTGATLGALTTQISAGQFGSVSGSAPAIGTVAVLTPTTAGTLFVALGTLISAAGTVTIYGGTNAPMVMIAELE